MRKEKTEFRRNLLRLVLKDAGKRREKKKNLCRGRYDSGDKFVTYRGTYIDVAT